MKFQFLKSGNTWHEVQDDARIRSYEFDTIFFISPIRLLQNYNYSLQNIHIKSKKIQN